MSKINVAIVGCGRISDLHALGYQRDIGARIYAVCDSDNETSQRRKKQWEADKAYTQLEQVLADDHVDAVEILTPHHLHEPMVCAALRAGKHVAVQKPVSTDLASADRMVAAARGAKGVYKVTDNYLFYPPLVRAKELIDDGAIGDPQCLHLKYIGGSSGGWPIDAASWKWRVQERMQGRPFVTFDHGHHLLAVAWYLFGEVERVVSYIDSLDGVIDSPAVAMWKHKEGARYGIYDAVHASDMHVPSRYYANDEWYEIAGSQGIIVVRRCTGEVLDGPPVSLFDGQRWTDFEDVDADWAAGFAGSTRNFARAIRGEDKPLLDGEQAREVLRFAFAMQRSSQQRREIFLDEVDGQMGRFGAWRRRRRQRPSQGSWWRRLVGGADTSRYAAQAWPVTEQLLAQVDAETARQIDFDLGLHLTLDNGVEERLGFLFREGAVEVLRDQLPEQAGVTLIMPAGLWAAILMRKVRVETALLRGQIAFEGKPELALKLRKVFGL